MAAITALLGIATPVMAQSETAQPPFQIGPVGLSPVIRLANVGWDSNVYNLTKDLDPVSDFTTALRPSVDASMRSPRLNLTAHSGWDYYYFNRQSSLRALDIDQSGRVEATLNRLSPYVSGGWTTTRHRQNLEIEALVRRRNHTFEGGTYVRLSAKTFVGVYGGRSVVEYEGGSIFRETELAPALNHRSVHAGAGLRYQATPLTTFAVDVTRARNRFASSPERDADSWQIGPRVEFKPLALISGSASLAFQKVRFRDASQPEFKSMVSTVNLQYTLHGRTQFAVTGQRSLEYSYLETQIDYVLAGLSTSVTHRMNDRWDVVGVVGRYGLGYRRRGPATLQAVLPNQTYWNYGTSLGYYLGRHRIGLDVNQNRRNADIKAFEFERLRVSSSLTYVF
jgi:hypothetical protein